MSKYTFVYELDDGTNIQLSGNKETIGEIIEDFGYFLQGASFSEELVNKYLNNEFDETDNV